MHFDWWTFVLQTANFAVLVWLLHRFLYRPVLKIIAQRETQIEQEYAQSVRTKAETQTRLDSLIEQERRAQTERDTILHNVTQEAEQMAMARHTRAVQESAKVLAEARKRIATERTTAFVETRRYAIELAGEMAQRLIAQIPAQLRAEAWLERVEEHLASLAAPERQSLLKQLEGGTAVRIITATALAASIEGLWRTRLSRALGGPVAAQFASDPQLIAGVELHFPTTVICLTWRSALAALRSAAEPHEGDVHANPQ